ANSKVVIRHANSSLAGKENTFEKDVITLGRREDNDIIFDVNVDTLVSGKHAEIRVDGSNGRQLTVNDCGSRNGTFVNGVRIERPTPLNVNDRLTLGQGGPALRVTFADQVDAAGPETMIGGGIGGGGAVNGGMSLDDAMAADRPAVRPFGGAPTPQAPPPPPRPAHKPAAAGAIAGLPPGKTTIGPNTLMGVLNENTKKERKRTAFTVGVVGIVCLVLLVAGVGASFLFTSTKTGGPTIEEQWIQTLATVSPSVYQIQKWERGETKDRFITAGTGWSVGEGILATNAHVAAMMQDLEDDEFVIARRGTSENDLRLVDYEIHPAYDSWDRMYFEYLPYVPAQEDFLGFLQAGDVALLKVHEDDWEKQAPPLQLAPETKLTGGKSVGYAGYPSENIKMDYEAPTQTRQRGEINSFSGVLAEVSTPDEAVFIRHNLDTAGGASGSPIVDINGNVVAVNFAGDYNFSVPGTRIPVSGFKFAIPVEYVQELVDGVAEERQKERDKTWEELFEAKHKTGIDQIDEIMIINFLSSRAQLQSRGIIERDQEFVLISEGVINVGRSGVTKEIEVLGGGGQNVISIAAEEPGHGMTFSLRGMERPINEAPFSEDDIRNLYHGSTSFAMGRGREQKVNLEVTVKSVVENKVHYKVWGFLSKGS
ncbi:MAG: FHA domain-containing protein, partial [Planctomycetota bacterium]